MAKNRKIRATNEGAPPLDEEAERIGICARLVALFHERSVINAGDPWAPDKGPLHARYEATFREREQLTRRLLVLGIPTSEGGVRAMAHLGITEAERTSEGDIVALHDDDWVVLAVAQGLARTKIPMVLAEAHYGSDGKT